jgi:aminotransferase
LQEAGALALGFPDAYYHALAAEYLHRRNRMMEILTTAGFVCFEPAGAYYVMTDIARFKFANDVEFAKHLVENIGVAVVPGSSFYNDPADGAHQVRFTFCKRDATLEAAAERLAKLHA